MIFLIPLQTYHVIFTNISSYQINQVIFQIPPLPPSPREVIKIYFPSLKNRREGGGPNYVSLEIFTKEMLLLHQVKLFTGDYQNLARDTLALHNLNGPF